MTPGITRNRPRRIQRHRATGHRTSVEAVAGMTRPRMGGRPVAALKRMGVAMSTW